MITAIIKCRYLTATAERVDCDPACLGLSAPAAIRGAAGDWRGMCAGTVGND